MHKIYACFYVIVFSSIFMVGNATPSCNTIKGYSGCACQMSDTSDIVGLEYIIKNDSAHRIPRFTTYDDIHWYFSFHPCGTFNMFLDKPRPNQPCIDASSVRFTNRSVDYCEGLGPRDESVFNLKPDFSYPVFSNLTLTFRNSTTSNGMVISLMCNRTVEAQDSVFTYVNVTRGVLPTYYFTLESKCCCPGGCTEGIHLPEDGLGVWVILGIVVGVLLLVLIIIFIVYFCCCKSSPERRPLLA